MDWEKAGDYLRKVKQRYDEIGAPGIGLMMIASLQRRFESGERSQELYDEIMSLE